MKALVIGASGGIGAALAHEAELRGFETTRLSRRTHGFDATDESSVRAALGAFPDAGFDLIFNATGGLSALGAPEKTLQALDPAAMAAHFALNATAVALLLKHGERLLAPGRAVFATLSARLGSIGDNRLGGWISYRAAKAAQNQIVRTVAVEWRRRRPEAIVAALHPGTVATPLTAPFREPASVDAPALSATRLLDVVAALTPADSGGFLDQHGRAIPW